VGDFFLDKYLEYDPELAEKSIETGKTANQVVGVRHSPGAAGTVVSNLAALGAAAVIPVGFTGDDGEGYELRSDLEGLGCDTSRLATVRELRTPTYLKPSNVRAPGLAGEAERYDTKNRAPLPGVLDDRLIRELRDIVGRVDAVVVADQVVEPECGVVTSSMRSALAEAAIEHQSVVFFADSRSRAGLFRNVVVKPNQFEVVAAACGEGAALTDEAVLAAGRELSRRTGKPAFVTRSEQGILVFDGTECIDVPGVSVEGDIDPTGAGDSATAGSVLALASGASTAEAALVANLVASITVQQIGVTGVARREQLPARLDLWKMQTQGRP
jgi:rfaE bifunctional protein kinase chain/domain